MTGYCRTALLIIENQGHEGIAIFTEDGLCPTGLYYHIDGCNECDKTGKGFRDLQLSLAEEAKEVIKGTIEE